MTAVKNKLAPSAGTPLMDDPKVPIAQRLGAVANLISRSAMRVYPEITGLKTVEARLLHGIGQYGPISAREVAAELNLHETQVSLAMKVVTRKKLVKGIQDPTDKRRRLLSLTESGKKISDKVDKILDERHKNILAGLTRKEQALFFEFLERVGKNAERLASK